LDSEGVIEGIEVGCLVIGGWWMVDGGWWKNERTVQGIGGFIVLLLFYVDM